MSEEKVNTGEKVRTEEFKVSGDQLIAKIKELLHQGHIRRITIRNEEGSTLVEMPLTLGLVGVILVPQLAALGAIAALLTHATIVIEKEETGS
jgi:hypothetical protein